MVWNPGQGKAKSVQLVLIVTAHQTFAIIVSEHLNNLKTHLHSASQQYLSSRLWTLVNPFLGYEHWLIFSWVVVSLYVVHVYWSQNLILGLVSIPHNRQHGSNLNSRFSYRFQQCSIKFWNSHAHLDQPVSRSIFIFFISCFSKDWGPISSIREAFSRAYKLGLRKDL